MGLYSENALCIKCLKYSMMKALNYSRTEKLLAITINKIATQKVVVTNLIFEHKHPGMFIKNMVKYGLKI